MREESKARLDDGGLGFSDGDETTDVDAPAVMLHLGYPLEPGRTPANAADVRF